MTPCEHTKSHLLQKSEKPADRDAEDITRSKRICRASQEREVRGVEILKFHSLFVLFPLPLIPSTAVFSVR